MGVVTGLYPSDKPRCSFCMRPMGPDNYGVIHDRCYPCNHGIAASALRAVIPISYSFSGGLTSLIAQAKDEPERPWVRRGLASLLCNFLSQHRTCLDAAAGGPLDVATIVPSHQAKRGGRDHLKALIAEVASPWPGARRWDLDLLVKTGESGAAGRRQKVDPHLFDTTPGTSLWGQRVLLVDDLFTSGSTLASAAFALAGAGAESVVAVTIGRQVDADTRSANFFEQNSATSRGLGESCALHCADAWW